MASNVFLANLLDGICGREACEKRTSATEAVRVMTKGITKLKWLPRGIQRQYRAQVDPSAKETRTCVGCGLEHVILKRCEA